jgi:hypothetical protein
LGIERFRSGVQQIRSPGRNNLAKVAILTQPGRFSNVSRIEPGIKPQPASTTMKSKSILAGAAIAGLMSGAFAVQAHAASVSGKAGVSVKRMADEGQKDVHSCKGQNSCKGKGGCQTGDNGCKGKNSCKGKGGCATDGSHDHTASPSPH